MKNMKQDKTEKYRLQVSAATRNLGIVRDFIRHLAKEAGFDKEKIEQIELAVDEACTNVIKHAYHYDASKMIDLRIRIDRKKMVISVIDYGGGFDLSKIKQPDINHNVKKAKAGGLGIHLMKKLMDEVQFHIEPGKKTEVRLIKFRSKP